MMANAILKSFKFANILNSRLTLNSMKLYHRQYFLKSYTNTRQRRAYATAAYKLSPNEDSRVKKNNARRNVIIKDKDSIDFALSDIDWAIKRSGRTQLKRIIEIFSAITSKDITTSTHALYLLRSCKYCYDEPPSKRIELVNQIWSRYQELGIEFNVKHYNALLNVHVSNGLDFNPAEMIASMEDLNIVPDKDTYMLIMKKYCQDGNITGASEVLQMMKEKEMSANEKVFNYLIEGHMKNKDIAGAKEMVEVMRSSNLVPTTETHTILACGYAAIGDKEEMIAHLKECKEIEDIQHYLKVINTLASSGNHQYIDDVLSMIENKNLYPQEFINLSVELIHKNLLDVAFKMAILSCNSDYCEGVHIFIKQLMKQGKEPSEVMHFCETIENKSINKEIFPFVTKIATEDGHLDYAVEFFKKLEERGYYVRSNKFWPLFASVKSPEGPWLVLKKMCEYGLPCDLRTYIEIVFPMLGMPYPDDILKKLEKTGHHLETAVDALFAYYCNKGEIDYADHLTQITPVKVNGRLNIANFVQLGEEISTQKFSLYLKLLKYMLTEGSISLLVNGDDIQGRLLAELIIKRPKTLEALLNKYEDLSFTEGALSACDQELKARNSYKQMFMRKLRFLCAEREAIIKKEDISAEEEDKYIHHLQAQNLSCRSFLSRRINYHLKEKNSVRVEELLKIFDELDMEYSPLMLTNLIGMWCYIGDLQKAEAALEKLKTAFPDFKLDLSKTLNYVTLLMKYEKFDESYEVLKNLLTGPYVFSNKDILARSLMRFSATLSNAQNAEYVKKMQNLILPLSKEIESKEVFVDSIVKFYLQRGDFKAAFEEFKNISLTHHILASLNTFLKKCINYGETNILQKVIDHTTSVCGKSYSLLELAVAFIETSNSNNAVKVIESLGEQVDPSALDDVCSRLSQQNKVFELEQLIFITKSLTPLNREKMYYHAITACANRGDFQKANELFQKLKKEVIESSPEIVRALSDILERSNQTTPLSISTPEKYPAAAEAVKTFIKYLEAGNVDATLKELNELKKGFIRTLSIKNMTDLVDLCLQNDRVQDLASNVQAMSYIIEKVKDVFKPIVEKYSEAGDVEKLNSIANFMPDFSLMSINFNTYVSKAYIASGQYESLLLELEKRIDKKNKLYSTTAFEVLLNIPEYEDRLLNLAVKYFEVDFKQPISVVWAHYFRKGNYERADEIYKNFLVIIEKVDNLIIRSTKQSENVALAKKYVDFVKYANARSRTKEKAYGTALDLLVLKGMYDEAVSLVVESEEQNLQLHKYYLSTLITLKNHLEKENKSVPFSIPDISSPSPSSDSE